MSLQYIIDRAQQIEIDRRKIVGQTISRSQRIKTSERASAQPWKWKVTPPGAMKWADARPIIELIDFNDRINEYTISLNNVSGMNYITEYRGQATQAQLDAMTLSSAGTSTFVVGSLPTIGSTLTSRTYNMTAVSFSPSTSATYNRAISTTRSDFLITNTEYDTNFYSIKAGDALTATTYITGGQTISSITRDYITLNGTGYTRIVMSANGTASSPAAVANGDSNITVTVSSATYVTSSTVLFGVGDLIQPANSRYPYTITTAVSRGSGSTVTVNLHRNVITSEGITYAGAAIKVGNSCTWRVIISGLPTYTLTPNRLVQYTGDIELFEKII
jgi:hypothetical protein